MPARRSISTWRGASGAPAVVPGAREADVRRRAEAAAHGLGRIALRGHGVHLDLRVLGERVADPAGAQVGRELVVGPVHDDDVERVHEAAGPLDEVLVPAVERCELPAATPRDSGLAMGGTMPDARAPRQGNRAMHRPIRLRGMMRAVSGPRVIVVGAGVYGLAAARRLALAGADVIVFEAREPGGSFAASAGSSRVLRFEYGAAAHYTELVLRARTQWRELERLLGETLYDETGMLWSAIEPRSTCTTRSGPARPPACRSLLEPAEAARRFPAFSLDGRRRGAARRGGRRVARAPRDARPGAARRMRRERRARGHGPCARSVTASSSSPTARGATADQVLVDHGRVDGRPAPRPHPLDPAGQRLPPHPHCRACPYGRTTSTSTASRDDGGAGTKVGGHVVGPDDRPRRRRGAGGAG